MYSKESIDTLRQKIDLVEVLSSHIELGRAGSSFKSLCPFHEEKSPSFVVQRGDTHYHCYGCGAHGDAIAFLMTHVKMNFVEAIESLAERFQVVLEKGEGGDFEKRPIKAHLKTALELASKLYYFLLLHSKEGQIALKYLYERGITLDFIHQFEVGFAPSSSHLLMQFLHAQGVEEPVVEQAGLMSAHSGRRRDFFIDRITFPIRDPMGAVIGFSARKYKEETFGGKYINTPETPLFKKSHVLFGLSYSRQRIAKESQAIIVEGQIDALQLIHAGFNYTVAGQGTAFGEDHVKELVQLGVKKVYLSLDADGAGQEAAAKIGNLFQKRGVEALVVQLPEGSDPDSVLKDRGPIHFQNLLNGAEDYLTFLFSKLSKGRDLHSPSQKNEIVEKMATMIRAWDQPVMVHESLRKLAEIAGVPESTIGVGQISLPNIFIKRNGSLKVHDVDPNRILETDLLRWLIIVGQHVPRLVLLAKANILSEHFHVKGALRIYEAYIQAHDAQTPCDLLQLGESLSDEDDHKLLDEVMQRKINVQKAEEGIKETLRKILVRHWMEKREAVRMQIHQGGGSEEELSVLAQEFDAIKKNIPELILP